MSVRCFGVATHAGTGVVRVFWFALLAWCIHVESGIFWLGTGRLRAMLRAPWNEPMFSERYGGQKVIKLGGGWRMRFFRTGT